MQKTHLHYPIWYIALAGFCALFIGLGLCRFAYTPLIPALIHQHWLNQAEAGYLGTINFVGYIIGAIFAKGISKRIGVRLCVKINFILSVLSLALCAFYWGFLWFAVWRFLAGITGAFLMVLTPTAILQHVPNHYRGKVSGIVFTGMGLGVVVSGFLFPALAQLNIIIAWLGAALFAFIASGIAWPVFSLKPNLDVTACGVPVTSPSGIKHQQALMLLAVAYALFGFGVVPHSLFLVDYVHTQLGLSLVQSGFFWSIFGIGSLVGPLCAGCLSDKIGSYKSLLAAFLLCCLAIALVLYNHISVFYILSSFSMGVLLPAIVTLMSSRIIELTGLELHPAFWGKMTVCYSISQALGAYLFSYMLHKGMGYSVCFLSADIAFLLGCIAIVFSRKIPNLHKIQHSPVNSVAAFSIDK